LARRTILLILTAVLIVAAAAGLRARSHLLRPKAPAWRPPVPASSPAAAVLPAEPPDYVARPVVEPAERTSGPGRIISLAPSITEVVCALGLADRLVGRTQYCRHIPGVEHVAEVGAMEDANLARIRGLGPDLVLVTANSGPLQENLRRLDLRCQAVPHESLEDVYRGIEVVGRLCDRPRTAARLVEAIRGDMARLREWAEKSGRPARRALVVLGEMPVPPQPVFVAGPGIFLDALVEMAGHRNAGRELLRSSHGEIPLEKLLILDPDVILEFRSSSTGPVMEDVYDAWAAVGPLKAVGRRQIRSVGGAEWLSAGPRIAVEFHRFLAALSEEP